MMVAAVVPTQRDLWSDPAAVVGKEHGRDHEERGLPCQHGGPQTDLATLPGDDHDQCDGGDEREDDEHLGHQVLEA